MKVAVVTLCIGDFAGQPWWGILNKRDYCALRRYGFHRYTAPLDRSRSPAWNKIPAILRHLPDYDWVFWSDADSLVLNHNVRLESFCDENADMVLTRDERGPSAGEMLIRNTPAARTFLQRMYDQNDLATHPHGESAALARLLEASPPDARVKFVAQESFNSDLAGYRPGHFLVHFARSQFKPAQMSGLQARSNLSINFREQFPMLCDSLGLRGQGVEVGVKLGDFSAILSRHWPGKMLHLVDCWCNIGPFVPGPYAETDQVLEQRYQDVVRRFAGNQAITIHRGLSAEVARGFTDEFFDWIYLDADHTYESVRADLNAWYPKLRNGGILAGHDFTDREYPWGKFGVRSAVMEFIQRSEMTLYITGEGDEASWYFVKG